MNVLLISDLHANPFALEVLPEADAVLCMGDLVDYAPILARSLRGVECAPTPSFTETTIALSRTMRMTA
jgi:hypothetical protein